MAKPKRMEAGTGVITTVTGEGTVTIAFDLHYDYIPVVVVSLTTDPGAGKRGLIWVHTITTTSCIIEIDSDVANGDYTFNFIAMEHRTSEKVAQ